MDHLEHGRECYERHSWGDAYQAFLSADQAAALQADDLERLATAAYLTGRDLEFRESRNACIKSTLTRKTRSALHGSAFWLAFTFLLRGETGQSNAWIAPGQHLVENRDCAAEGDYLRLLVLWFAEYVLGNLSALWVAANVEDRLRLQEAMFPTGIVWDGERFGTGVTSSAFSWLRSIPLANQEWRLTPIQQMLKSGV